MCAFMADITCDRALCVTNLIACACAGDANTVLGENDVVGSDTAQPYHENNPLSSLLIYCIASLPERKE